MSPDARPAEQAGGRGYTTLAVGDRRYLEMAVDMALSARAHSELGVALVGDEPALEGAARDFPGVFAHLRPLADRFRDGRAVKYGVVEATPFERAFFLDADCLVLADLAPWWVAMEGVALAFAGERLAADDDRFHHGFSTRRLAARFDIPAYLKANSGVFYYEREAARPFMEACLACYRDELLPRLRGGFLGDELAIGIVGGRRGTATFEEPGLMSWPDEMGELDPAAPAKPVCHMIGPLPPPALTALLDEIDRRRLEVGLPADSGVHWRRKHARAVRSRRLTRLGRPFLPLARALRLGTTRNL